MGKHDRVGAAVGAIIHTNYDYGRIYMCRRLDSDDMFNPPCGAIEQGEKPLDALAREVREETGRAVRTASLLAAMAHHSKTSWGSWVTLWYRVTVDQQPLLRMEPSKHGPWVAVRFDEFSRARCFGSTDQILDFLKKGDRH